MKKPCLHVGHIQEIQRLESSIAAIRHAYEAEVCGRQALLAELEEQKIVQERLEEILAWVRDLQEAWQAAGNGGFNESFREVMKSVQKLQEAVGEICKNAPHWTEPIFVQFYLSSGDIFTSSQYGHELHTEWLVDCCSWCLLVFIFIKPKTIILWMFVLTQICIKTNELFVF